MKKILSFVLLCIIVLSTLNGQVASLNLSGIVQPVITISLSTSAVANLPIGSAVSNLLITKVTETTNVKLGYTVSLSSLNNCELKETGGTDFLAYSLTYDGNAVIFSSGSALISNSSIRTGVSGTQKDLNISFAASFLNAGTYTDILTFTITSK